MGRFRPHNPPLPGPRPRYDRRDPERGRGTGGWSRGGGLGVGPGQRTESRRARRGWTPGDRYRPGTTLDLGWGVVVRTSPPTPSGLLGVSMGLVPPVLLRRPVPRPNSRAPLVFSFPLTPLFLPHVPPTSSPTPRPASKPGTEEVLGRRVGRTFVSRVEYPWTGPPGV